nr:reverse transcriptase domain-containing protein [Tanacetum cinerariifolium]
MFRQTLSGAARIWFDDLDPKSVDSFEELSHKFLEEFSQKRYAKDPTEIHDEMFERVKAFIRGKVAAGSAEKEHGDICFVLKKKNVHASHQNTKGDPNNGKCKLPTSTTFDGDSREAKFKQVPRLPWRQRTQHERLLPLKEEVMASGKLAHLVKDIRQGNKRNRGQGRGNVKVINTIGLGGNRKRPYETEEPRVTEEIEFPSIPRNSLTDALIILEGTIEGFRVRRIYVDRGNSSEIMGNLPPSRVDRPPGNHERTKKKQNRPVGVRHSEMSLTLQCHPRENGDEKPRRSRINHTLNDQFPTVNGVGKGAYGIRRTMGEDTVKEKVVIRDDRPEQLIVINRWVTNAVSVKQRDGTWKVHMDFSSLNKVCPKDMYPFPKIEEKLGSLAAHQYKCFLRIPREGRYKCLRTMKKRQASTQKKSVLFHSDAEGDEELRNHPPKGDEQGACRAEGKKCGSIPRRSEGCYIRCSMSSVPLPRASHPKVSKLFSTSSMGPSVVTVFSSRVSPSGSGLEACPFGWFNSGSNFKCGAVLKKHEARSQRMCLRDGRRQVLGLRGDDRRDKSRTRKGESHTSEEPPQKSIGTEEAFNWTREAEEAFQEIKKRDLRSKGEPSRGIDPNTKAYRFSIGRESTKEGSGVDYEALLTGLVASAKRQMKDLHVFVSSRFVVDQVKGNRFPRTEGTKRYKEEVMDTTPHFHRIPKSVGVKTRYSVEALDKPPEETKNLLKKATSGKSSPTWEDHGGSN